ncbi:uncharacterized protein LOC114526148 [Dendronephthya gigantea]|uniref:uncharacterized protein LOC114526148 n=1 Tax=Dendronephthya gigantea TaxID=151771 RepID=UPI00106B17C7|nr:uncharacterized protein LOC114526148 [Dendronephthya gigantea]
MIIFPLSSFILLAGIAIPAESLCGCRIPFKAIGCRKDKRHDRALPKMLINERDRYSSHYNGFDVDWMNWDEYLPAFTCRCAEAAMKKGYKYFGLQFWGECWSGPSPAAEKGIIKHARGKKCYGPQYKKCDSNSNNCVGAENHNFIYEIHPYQCPVKFERLGCYRDRKQKNTNDRPLSDYLLTDRDKRHSVSSGRDIDWYNYDTYLPELACRCAMKTVEEGWDTFGLQYYGECWSGERGNVTYYQDGETSTCKNKCFKTCTKSDSFCTGEQKTNYVYRITGDVCEIPYTATGCYNEIESQRALPEFILDDVNPASPKFMGIINTDFSDWEEYMKGFVCRCARKVLEKGYNTFGIFNEGQCYSGPTAETTYNKHGESDQCFYNGTLACSSRICAGGKKTTYVYQL